MSFRMSARAVLVICSMTAVGHGQTTAVVPGQLANAEGVSRGEIAGFTTRARMQILLSAATLTDLVGKNIEAIEFRRDRAYGRALDAASSTVTVRLAPASQSPSSASQVFALNCGFGAVETFQGAVSLPASPAGQTSVSWGTENTVSIGFTTPYPYGGGDLCIEIEGAPDVPGSPALWSVDYEHEAPSGTVESFGSSCSSITSAVGVTAAAWERGLVPGSTFSAVSFGRPSTPGVAFLGVRLPTGVVLDPIGATGCVLNVSPATQLPLTYGGDALGRGFGTHRLYLHLPAISALLSANFALQWANLETVGPTSNPLALTTTNGLDVTVADTLVPGTLTTVFAADPVGPGFPSSGVVMGSRGPVIRLRADAP